MEPYGSPGERANGRIWFPDLNVGIGSSWGDKGQPFGPVGENDHNINYGCYQNLRRLSEVMAPLTLSNVHHVWM